MEDNKEYINIDDSYKVSDSKSFVTGFVVGHTKDGKILFKKNNMIVESGRRVLLRKIISQVTGSSGTDTNFNIFDRIYPIFGESDVLTRPDMSVVSQAALTNNFGNISSAGSQTNIMGISSLTVQLQIVKESKNSRLGLRCMGMILMEDKLFETGTEISTLAASQGGYIFKRIEENGQKYYVLPTESSIQSGSQYAVGTLFSRVTFPPYPDSSQLIIDYTFFF